MLWFECNINWHKRPQQEVSASESDGDEHTLQGLYPRTEKHNFLKLRSHVAGENTEMMFQLPVFLSISIRSSTGVPNIHDNSSSHRVPSIDIAT